MLIYLFMSILIQPNLSFNFRKYSVRVNYASFNKHKSQTWAPGQASRARPSTVKEAADNYTDYLEQRNGKTPAADARGRIKLQSFLSLQMLHWTNLS